MFPLNTNDGIRDRLLLLLLQAREDDAVLLDGSSLILIDFREVCCSFAGRPYVGMNRPVVLIDAVVVRCGLLCPLPTGGGRLVDRPACYLCTAANQRTDDGAGATCIIHSPEKKKRKLGANLLWLQLCFSLNSTWLSPALQQQ